MEQQQISAKKLKAMEKVKRANAELAKVVREEKEQTRKAQDRHKYMMGGCVVKYFPEAYDFSEQEMNRIIACAFSLKAAHQALHSREAMSKDAEQKSRNQKDPSRRSSHSAEKVSNIKGLRGVGTGWYDKNTTNNPLR